MLASILDPTSTIAIVLQILIILGALLLGTRYGGLGLGLISGIGLMIMVFIFGLEPGEPPVGVMLTIIAVIGCAATLQQARGLEVNDATGGENTSRAPGVAVGVHALDFPE